MIVSSSIRHCYCIRKLSYNWFCIKYVVGLISCSIACYTYMLCNLSIKICQFLVLILLLYLCLFFAAWKPVWAWYIRVLIQPIRATQAPASVCTAYRGKESLHHHVMTSWILPSWFLRAIFLDKGVRVLYEFVYNRHPSGVPVSQPFPLVGIFKSLDLAIYGNQV